MRVYTYDDPGMYTFSAMTDKGDLIASVKHNTSMRQQPVILINRVKIYTSESANEVYKGLQSVFESYQGRLE